MHLKRKIRNAAIAVVKKYSKQSLFEFYDQESITLMYSVTT